MHTAKIPVWTKVPTRTKDTYVRVCYCQWHATINKMNKEYPFKFSAARGWVKATTRTVHNIYKSWRHVSAISHNTPRFA